MRLSLIAPAGVLTAAALAAGCGSAGPSVDAAPVAAKEARAAQPALPAGRIAFRRYFDAAQKHGAVFTINPDGTDEKQITRPPAGVVDDQPDWSPDGKRIAFERCSEAKPCAVFTVAAGGGRPHRVPVRCHLKPICDAGSPSWTPDGRLVVNVAEGREKLHGDTGQIERSSVALVDARHHAQRTLVARTGWRGDTTTPAVAPDGRTVVYMRWNSWRTNPAGGNALYVVDVDGKNHHRVTPWELGAGDHPVFSPDGSTILFRSFAKQEDKQSDYWTVHPDGTGLSQLTHVKQGSHVWSTSYSSDGAWIVHATDGVDGEPDVFVMRADGTGNRPVTRTRLWDSAADWGPPGS